MSWRQQKETLLLTYKVVGRLIINKAAPMRCQLQKHPIQALRIPTSCHKMASADHLHIETKVLKVREHRATMLLLLFALGHGSSQSLVKCLEPENVINSHDRDTPKRRRKETLFTRHHSTVEPIMIAKDRKPTLQTIHTNVVNQTVNS